MTIRALRRIAPLVAAALALTVGIAVPGPARAAVAEKPIQPGARLSSPVGGCTFNFVFRRPSNGALFIGTAGHCTNVGDTIRDGNGWRVGTTVLSDFSGISRDFALVEIDSGRYGDVSPQVRFWGGPTGVALAGTTLVGDPVFEYGYGMIFSTTSVTRPRAGTLSRHTTAYYTALHPSIFGDSGGPFIHGPTGKALGVVSQLAPGVPPSSVGGPTMELVMNYLAIVQGGVYADLELVTAPAALLP